MQPDWSGSGKCPRTRMAQPRSKSGAVSVGHSNSVALNWISAQMVGTSSRYPANGGRAITVGRIP